MRLLCLFALTSPLVAPAIFAQATEAKTSEQVTVYGTRIGEDLRTVPASVTILEKEELQQQENAGENLGSVLGKLLPGIGAPTGSLSNYGQSLRGRDVLILIDGVPQTENRAVSRQLNNIAVGSIERVEVISGSNAIYGSGAIGGIINIITKKPTNEKAAFETVVGTSFATKPIAYSSQDYLLQQSVSGTTDAFDYIVSVGGEMRNNIYDASGKLIPNEPAQVSRNDTDSYSAYAKVGHNFSADSRIQFSVEGFKEKQDSDYYARANPYRAEPGLELDDQAFSERLQTQLTYDNASFAGHELQLLAYYRERAFGFNPFTLTSPVPLINQSTTEASVYGLKGILKKEFSPSFTLAYGLDYEMDKGRQRARGYNQLRNEISNGRLYTGKTEEYDYGPAIDTQKTAIFGQAKWDPTADLHTRFGARYEYVEQDVHDFLPPLETAIGANWSILYAGIAGQEAAGRVPEGTTASLPVTYRQQWFDGDRLNYDATTWNAGVSYDIAPKHLIYFNFAQGYELADTARLLRDAVAPGSLIPVVSPIFRLTINSTTVDNLDMDVITTSHYETGWRGNFGPVSSNLALFYNTSDKVYQFNRDFTIDLLDREKRVYGAEANIDWQIGSETLVRAGHSTNKGEYRRPDNSGWTAVSAMELSPPKTTLGVEQFFNESFSGSVQAMHIAPYNKADDVDIAEYFVMDASGLIAFNESNQLKIGLLNALNRRYKTVFHQWAEEAYGETSGAPASGRRVSLMYRYTF